MDRDKNKFFNNCWRILDASAPEYYSRITSLREQFLSDPVNAETQHHARLESSRMRFNDLISGRPEIGRTIIESHEDHLSAMGRIAREVGALKRHEKPSEEARLMVPEKVRIDYEPIRVEAMPTPDSAGRSHVWLKPTETYYTIQKPDSRKPQPDGRRIQFGLVFVVAGPDFENPAVINSDASQTEQPRVASQHQGEYVIDAGIRFSHVLLAAEDAIGGQMPLFDINPNKA